MEKWNLSIVFILSKIRIPCFSTNGEAVSIYMDVLKAKLSKFTHKYKSNELRSELVPSSFT